MNDVYARHKECLLEISGHMDHICVPIHFPMERNSELFPWAFAFIEVLGSLHTVETTSQGIKYVGVTKEQLLKYKCS